MQPVQPAIIIEPLEISTTAAIFLLPMLPLLPGTTITKNYFALFTEKLNGSLIIMTFSEKVEP